MPLLTLTCGECGASTKIADGDWKTVQAPAIQAWMRNHGLNAHRGGKVASWKVVPRATAN